MIVVAWRNLQKTGALSHAELLEDLHVKTLSLLIALLAQFTDAV
jgi:hypothetical protein